MKRFFIALALLVTIISGTVFTSFTAGKKLEESGSAVLACAEKGADSQKIKEAIRVWEKNRKFLFAVTFHDDFSEIEGKITELEYYSSHPDSEKSSKISYETGMMLKELAEDFYVTLENIF